MMKLTRKQLRRLIQEAFYLPNRLLHDEDLMAHVKNMRKNHYTKEEIEKADMLTNMPGDPWALDSGIQLGGLPYDREDKPTIDFFPNIKLEPKFVFPPDLDTGNNEYGIFSDVDDMEALIEVNDFIYDIVTTSPSRQKIHDVNNPNGEGYYFLQLDDVYKEMADLGVSKDVIDLTLDGMFFVERVKIKNVEFLKIEEQ